MQDLKVFGVIGAGTMGTGVAIAAAAAGYDTILYDLNKDALDKARAKIDTEYKLMCFINEDNTYLSYDALIEKICFLTDLNALEKADFIVENIAENISLKEQLYKQLSIICKDTAIIATNTSGISVDLIASWVQHSSSILGIHFMNPANVSSMVEVVKGSETSDETLEVALEVMGSLGKSYRVVNDAPGFVINRVLMLAINEAIGVVEEKTADPESIDSLFQGCLGHRMGPLATADLIGLDVIKDSLVVLQQLKNSELYKPKELLEKMVEQGRLGKKCGQGFYTY